MLEAFIKQLEAHSTKLQSEVDKKVTQLPETLLRSFVEFYNIKNFDESAPKTKLSFVHKEKKYEVQLPGQFTEEQLHKVLYYLKIKL